MSSILLFEDREIAWPALDDAVLRAAHRLERLGVGEDDVVCIMLRNDPAFLVAAFAALRLGAYSCPINWHYKADEAGWILADSGAKVLVAHADLLPQIEGALPAGVEREVVAPQDWDRWLRDEPRWAGAPRRLRGNMPYTSGTTGRPKGVRRVPAPLEGAERMAELAREARYKGFGIEPGMRALLPGPLYHSAPNLYATQTLLLEDALLVLEPRFDPERTLALIERHRLSHAYLVPTMFVRMLKLPEETKRRYDLSSLRFVATTGSPCAADVKRAMIEWWGPVFHECYASSEAGVITSIDSREALLKPGSAGRPVGVGALRILDEQGRELPPGEIGLIYARQPAYPDFAYNNNPAARAALERDGLWTLGDMGYLDEDGYLFICDRASDMVISGGVNIYPAEIEAVLHGMPGVHDCAVFGVPSEEFGESLAAAIQPEPGAKLDAASVQAWLAARISGYKVPRLVEFHDALPREDSGKIFKRKLRAPHWEKAGRRI
ncbi:MAG TPA: AMP-binding protein [Burkholderiales bacterium]|nr:AMP-binding protein [Burkholderiales bacterium]